MRLKDFIITVDDKSMQTMNAVKLSKILARRSSNAVRKIIVLKVMTSDPGMVMVGGGRTPANGGGWVPLICHQQVVRQCCSC